MQIPKQVRIGSIDYDVVDPGEAILFNGQQCYGMIDFVDSQIYLDTTIQGKQKLELTFLHEVVHGMLQSRSLDEAAANETLVDEIAIALHQLIRDNPKIFESVENAKVEEEEEDVTDNN